MLSVLGRDGGELTVDVGKGRDKRERKRCTEEGPGSPVSTRAHLKHLDTAPQNQGGWRAVGWKPGIKC